MNGNAEKGSSLEEQAATVARDVRQFGSNILHLEVKCSACSAIGTTGIYKYDSGATVIGLRLG